MVLYICPEVMADSLWPNQNPRARNKRAKIRCPQTEPWDHLWLLGGSHRMRHQMRKQRNDQRVKIIPNYYRNQRKRLSKRTHHHKGWRLRKSGWKSSVGELGESRKFRSQDVRSKWVGRKWTREGGEENWTQASEFPVSEPPFKYSKTVLKSSLSLCQTKCS